jgi:threonylcarbamoyladenosine tRNA methylthiotransferase MtaB
MPNSVKTVTLGCRLNSFESEVMRNAAEQAGLANSVLINSCAVTAEAERQTRQAIRRARKNNPSANIVVSGCAAQLDPQKYAAMPEVDAVIGNSEKLDPDAYDQLVAQMSPADGGVSARDSSTGAHATTTHATWQTAQPELDDHGASEDLKSGPISTPGHVPIQVPILVGDIAERRTTPPPLVDELAGRTRAIVEVQTGCDHRCSFCIIPFGRGPSRSVPAVRIAEQLQRLVDNGTKEVVLSGVDIASYGSDLSGHPPLGAMVGQVLQAVPNLRRLRLSSIDPAAIDSELLGLFEDEPRLMPHVHLSVQAGDNLILKRMKRRHSREQVIALAAQLRARRPDIVLGADFITGFPTETDEMFDKSSALIDEAGLTYLHVFSYSERPGTPASRMPTVDVATRRARAAALRKLGTSRVMHFLSKQIGNTVEILAETEHRGRSNHFATIVTGEMMTPGSLRIVRLTGLTGPEFVGELVGETVGGIGSGLADGQTGRPLNERAMNERAMNERTDVPQDDLPGAAV